MDEDVKALLAILALVYGSSNGLGLFKDSLDPVAVGSGALNDTMSNPASARSFVRSKAASLFRSLWSLDVVIYVLLALLPPLFLLLVALVGAHDVLAIIGLGAGAAHAATPHGALFYWILVALAVLSSAHLLSAYLTGWGVVIRAWRWRPI
jgi:hypothetical protein